MNGTTTDPYPPGDMRVSDADRDRAVSELTAAYQAGRLRHEEFDERSTKALHAATGKELTDLLTDLPADRAAADLEKQGAVGVLATRIVMGATAVSLGFLALANGLSTPAPAHVPTAAQREFARQVLASQGIHVSNIPVQPATVPGFDWAGTITPAVIALLLIALIVVLHKSGLDRRIIRPSRS
jgi:Domain of unknown function (DUF1707)